MAAYNITLRANKGSTLTWGELDASQQAVQDLITALGLDDASSNVAIASRLLAPQLYVTEAAAAAVDTAGQGQLWVRSDTPNTLMFTDDAGTDYEVAGSTVVSAGFWSQTGNDLNYSSGNISIGSEYPSASLTTTSDWIRLGWNGYIAANSADQAGFGWIGLYENTHYTDAYRFIDDGKAVYMSLYDGGIGVYDGTISGTAGNSFSPRTIFSIDPSFVYQLGDLRVGTNGPGLLASGQSRTVPCIRPDRTLSTVGIGSNNSGTEFSLIASSIETARVSSNGVWGQLVVSPEATIGTATNPSLGFGDTDSGFYESADDQLSLTLGGTERFRFLSTPSVLIGEAAAAAADVAAYGQLWVRNDTPNRLMFTNDAGTDYQVSGPGSIVQVVNVQDGALSTGTTVMNDDDTIPQNTEGDEYMTLAITPTNASNKLKIEVVVNMACSASGNTMAALFQDATADALTASHIFQGTANGGVIHTLTYYMTAGTASATTFKVRAGLDRAGTTTFNGVSGGRLLGGVNLSSITITEIAA